MEMFSGRLDTVHVLQFFYALRVNWRYLLPGSLKGSKYVQYEASAACLVLLPSRQAVQGTTAQFALRR